MDWQIVLFRRFDALVLSGLIGIERALVDTSAGLRTHMPVGMTACLYGLVTF